MSETKDTKEAEKIVLEEQAEDDDEEEDPYNARIERTGCFQENEDLQLCFFDKKDWRLCKDEMQKFRDCFTKNKDNAGSKELLESSRSTSD